LWSSIKLWRIISSRLDSQSLIKMQLYNRVLTELKTNKQLRESNQEIAIPFPFKRFSNFIPGIQRGRYIITTASSKVGKSKFTDFSFVYSPIEYVVNNVTNLDVKVLYFSLEMSKEDKMKELTCYLLYKYYGHALSPEEVSSVFKDKILSNEVLAILESEAFNVLINKFEERVIFYDNTRNPFGIYKTVREYANANGEYYDKNGVKLDKHLIYLNTESEVRKIDHYKPHNKNEYVIVITDHISLLTPEKNHHSNLHDAMGDFSSNYCLNIRDKKIWRKQI